MATRPSGLELGPAVRSRRAMLKRAIGSGSVRLPELLEGTETQTDEETALGMRVDALLLAVPGVGETTARDVLNGAGIIGSARLADLTVRARRDLVGHLRKETT